METIEIKNLDTGGEFFLVSSAPNQYIVKSNGEGWQELSEAKARKAMKLWMKKERKLRMADKNQSYSLGLGGS